MGKIAIFGTVLVKCIQIKFAISYIHGKILSHKFKNALYIFTFLDCQWAGCSPFENVENIRLLITNCLYVLYCCLKVADNFLTWILGKFSISFDPSTPQRCVPTLKQKIVPCKVLQQWGFFENVCQFCVKFYT